MSSAAESAGVDGESQILVAARETFELVGARRSTIEDVARRAGVSRSSVYRAYPTKGLLLRAVLDDALSEMFEQFETVSEGRTAREAAVECFVLGIAMMKADTLLPRLMHTDPDLISGLGSDSPGSAVLATAERVVAILKRCGSSGADGDLDAAAELMLRVAFSYMVSPGGAVDLADPVQVRRFAERYLAPAVPL